MATFQRAAVWNAAKEPMKGQYVSVACGSGTIFVIAESGNEFLLKEGGKE